MSVVTFNSSDLDKTEILTQVQKTMDIQMFLELPTRLSFRRQDPLGTEKVLLETNVNDWVGDYCFKMGWSRSDVSVYFGQTEILIPATQNFGCYYVNDTSEYVMKIVPRWRVKYLRYIFFVDENDHRMEDKDYELTEFDCLKPIIESFIKTKKLNPRLCQFKNGTEDLCVETTKVSDLFRVQDLDTGIYARIKVKIMEELLVVFPLEYPVEARPHTTLVLSKMDVVKNELKKYFEKEDLIIFDSDFTVNGFPIIDGAIMDDMGVEPGSRVAIARVMNAGPLEQLARVKWRLSVAKATLKDKKRKYLQADVEGSILESVYTSGYHCKKESILALKRQLREFELDLSNTTKRYRKERVSKDKEINDAREEMDESKEMFNKLDAKRMRLETVVAVSTAESVAVSECIICHEPIKERGILNCKHALACVNCYAIVFAREDPCPTCRTKITSVDQCYT